MSLAERLYRQSSFTITYETPPLWLDITFILLICIIHIIYAFKFTRFSLAYLYAKCQEKQSFVGWSSSKLYLTAILSHNHKNKKLNLSTDYRVSTKLWMQLTLIRNGVRIIMFLLCWIVLVLYIILILNVFFEYLLSCILYYQYGSFLGFIALPPFIFINITIIRYIFFGTMVSWSLNVDHIADQISSEKQQKIGKKYALRNSLSVKQSKEDNNNDIDVKMEETEMEETEMKEIEMKEMKEMEEMKEINELNKLQNSANKRSTFKQILFQFTSPYFMAVHWRLSIVFCCILATIISLPLMSFQGDLQDRFWFQVFLRYMLIAVVLWLILYVIISIVIGLYCRIYTLSMSLSYKNDDDKIRWKRKSNQLFRFFCLMDTFDLEDTHKTWKKCKVIMLALIVISGILCIFIGPIIKSGLIWFCGCVLFIYYTFNILITTKQRGIYYLWKGDMMALELENDDKIASHSKSHSDNLHKAHVEDMRRLSSKQIVHTLRIKPSQSTKNIVSENEKDVIPTFCKLYIQIEKNRAKLLKEREMITCPYLIRDSLCFCCPGIIRPINCLILINYLYSVSKTYKAYWFLILPYNYDIRPLSILPTRNRTGILLEKIIKFDYAQNTVFQTIIKGIQYIWDSMKGICCCLVMFVFILLILWITPKLDTTDNNMETSLFLTDDDELNITNSSNIWSSLPICGQKLNADLSIIDILSLSHLSHEIGKREYIVSMDEMICLYFDGIRTENCSWRVIYIQRQEPVFMHLRNDDSNTDIIALRGTESRWDQLQDFNLFNQVLLLQTVSWIIPITLILPQSFIIQIVYFMSLFEGSIDREIRQRYDDGIFKYSYNFLNNTSYKIDSLYFAGHSLGGAIGSAVSGQLHHSYKAGFIINHRNKDLISNKLDLKGIAYSSPGMVYNSRKFSFDLNDLYSTTILLKVRHDAISNIDIPGGLVQNVQCSESQIYQCHTRKNTICELATKCGLSSSKNPKLMKTMCINKDIAGSFVSWMSLLYNITNINPADI